MSEEMGKQISEIDEEIGDIKKSILRLKSERTISKEKLEDLTAKRLKLQKLMEAGERAQKILEAEKRRMEIEKQAKKERRRIYDAQQIVIEASKNLEALNFKALGLSKEFPELKFMHFSMPEIIKKFTCHDSVPKEWAEL